MSSAQPQPPVAAALSPTAGYASIGSRIRAYLIDAVVSLFAVVPGYACLVAAASDPYQVNTGLFNLGLLLLAATPALAIYQWYLVATQGCTIGKRRIGIRVVDATTRRPIGWGRAFVRQFVLGLLGGVSCGILAAVSIGTASSHARRQAWHDLAADTVVIDAAATEAPVTRAPARESTSTPGRAQGNRPSLASGALVSEAPKGPVPPVQAPPVQAPPIVPRAPMPVAPVAPVASQLSSTGLIQAVPGVTSTPPPVARSEIDDTTRAGVRRAPRDTWQLRADDGSQIGLSGPVLVGRDPDAGEHHGSRAVAVPDPERSMSKTHALFTADGERLEVEDWSSTNGTFVTRGGSDRELPPRTPTQLEPGDQVTLGDRIFTVESSR